MPTWPLLSQRERKVFTKLPRWRYQRRPGGIERACLFLNSDGAPIKPSVLKDVGRFLNFDGIETTPKSRIVVDLHPVEFAGFVRSIRSAIDILSEEVRATRRNLEFGLTLPPDLVTRDLLSCAKRLRVPVTLRWDECFSPGRPALRYAGLGEKHRRNRTLAGERISSLVSLGLLREVALVLSPGCVELLDGVLAATASLSVPVVSLQMEYARRWTLYEYYLVEQAVRRLNDSEWRIGRMTVRLGEPMCRRPRGAVSCGAGVTKVAIGSDGTLFPCHRFAGDKKRAIGTAALGFWPGVLGLHRYRADQNVDCRGCPLLPRCDACCIWFNLRETGRMDRTTSAVCEFAKMLYAGAGEGPHE
jgi:radical SAM protein with 4Fe4S-binding SPASM domain